MAHFVRDAGVWKPVNNAFVRDAGVWKPTKSGYARDAGVWKKFGYARFNDLDTVAIAQNYVGGTTSFTGAAVATPASPDRYAIVVAYGGNASVTSMTVNGAAVTPVVIDSANHIYYAIVAIPTGTTLDASCVTGAVSGGNVALLYAYAVTCSGAPPFWSSFAQANVASASTLTTSVARPASGFVIGFGISFYGGTLVSVGGDASDYLTNNFSFAGFNYHGSIDPDNLADTQSYTTNWSTSVSQIIMWHMGIS